MTLTDSVCEKIKFSDYLLRNKADISFLLIILWGNGVYINRKIQECIIHKIYGSSREKLIPYFYDSIEKGYVTILPVSLNACVRFFTLLIFFEMNCSKKMREKINQILKDNNERACFNVACKTYFDAIYGRDFNFNVGRKGIVKNFKKKYLINFSNYYEKKVYSDASYGPRMSDSNSVWSNNISKFVIHIPMGGQNKKY